LPQVVELYLPLTSLFFPDYYIYIGLKLISLNILYENTIKHLKSTVGMVFRAHSGSSYSVDRDFLKKARKITDLKI